MHGLLLHFNSKKPAFMMFCKRIASFAGLRALHYSYTVAGKHLSQTLSRFYLMIRYNI